MDIELTVLLFACAGITLGGIVKGATGAGAPLVGVPFVAVVFDVQTAVAIFAVLNVISNSWQAKVFYKQIEDRRFAWWHAAAAAVGVVPGTLLLAHLPTDVIMLVMAGIVALYVVLRLSRPDWVLSRQKGNSLSVPIGFIGGLMQGAGGLSAPVTIPFFNALRLSRLDFIGSISVFFLSMAALQVPSLLAFGLLTWERATLGFLAAIPLFFGIFIGTWLARHMSRNAFDSAILVLLTVIAAKLAFDALT